MHATFIDAQVIAGFAFLGLGIECRPRDQEVPPIRLATRESHVWIRVTTCPAFPLVGITGRIWHVIIKLSALVLEKAAILSATEGLVGDLNLVSVDKTHLVRAPLLLLCEPILCRALKISKRGEIKEVLWLNKGLAVVATARSKDRGDNEELFLEFL